MCASLSYTCTPWQLPDTWCYDRLVPSLPKLCTVHYRNTCDNWLMFCYAILSFNFSFIHDISHSLHFILAISHYVHTGYARALFPYFYTLNGVLTPWICTSIYMVVIFYWSGYWGGAYALRGAGVLLLDHPFLVLYHTFFYFVEFYWFSIAWTLYYSIDSFTE